MTSFAWAKEEPALRRLGGGGPADNAEATAADPSGVSAVRLDIRRIGGDWSGMPKMRKKSDLPSKPCAVCGRPFTWRKKWEKVWADVKFCSDACRMRKHSAATRP